jgi:uncharacterized membrane protein YkgB
MDKVFIVIGAAIVGIASIVFLSFLLSWPVMWLWNNALVGAVIGVNEVSWLQAWGISVLSGILFKTTVSTSK